MEINIITLPSYHDRLVVSKVNDHVGLKLGFFTMHKLIYHFLETVLLAPPLLLCGNVLFQHHLLIQFVGSVIFNSFYIELH